MVRFAREPHPPRADSRPGQETAIEWRYYLVTNTAGRRVAFAFTVEGSLAKRLGDADRKMVNAVVFGPPATDGPVETAVRSATGRN